MKSIKKGMLFTTIVLISVFSAEEVRSMVKASVESKEFSVNFPLTEWPMCSSLRGSTEFERYNSTWDELSTLDNNKNILFNRFIKTCCDFSFRECPIELGRIHVGKVSGQNLLFVEKNVCLKVRSNSSSAWLSDKNSKGREIKVPLDTTMFADMKPISFTKEISCNLFCYLKKIVEDPLGCELFRRAIAKYEASEGNLDKIKFIPVEKEGIDIAFSHGGNIGQYIGKSKGDAENIGAKKRFIMFSPGISEDGQRRRGLKVKLKEGGSIYSWNKFEISSCTYPVDAGLFYQIAYAINDDLGNSEINVIEERAGEKRFSFTLGEHGQFTIPVKQLDVSIFSNDAIYRIMFGLTSTGLDIVNEAAYMAHRYNYIRPAAVGVKTKLQIYGKTIDSEEMFDFVKRFLRVHGDFDLYKYYLSSEFLVKYPEFGKGAYACIDL